MAVTFRKNSSRETLFALAAEHNVAIAEDADRATIIAALEAYNAAQGAQDGAEGAGASDATNDTTDGGNAAQGAQDGADAQDVSGYNMFVYVGPSLPNGRLKENAVFRGTFKDVSDYLADVLEQYPQAAKLIVPSHRLGEFSAKVKKPGNVFHKYYTDIVSTMRGNKEV